MKENKYLKIDLLKKDVDINKVVENFAKVAEKINKTKRIELQLFGDQNTPLSERDFLDTFKSMGVHTDIIAEAIAEVYNLKIFNYYKERDFSKVIVGDDFILDSDGIIYFVNPFTEFSNVLKSFLNDNKEMILIKDFGIISERVFNSKKLELRLKERSFNPLNSKPHYYDIVEIMQGIYSLSIKKKAESFLIRPSMSGSDFFLYIDGRYVKNDLFLSFVDIDEISKYIKINYRALNNKELSYVWEVDEEKYKFSFSFKNILIEGKDMPVIEVNIYNLNKNTMSLNDFGIKKDEIDELTRRLEAPYGFAIISGGKRSGKTTFMYLLAEKYKEENPDKSVFVVSNKIEKESPSISQMLYSSVNDFLNDFNGIDDVILIDIPTLLDFNIDKFKEIIYRGNKIVIVSDTGNLLLNVSQLFNNMEDISFVSEAFLFAVNIVTFTKVCQNCSKKIRFLDSKEYRRYFDLNTAPKSRDEIKIVNKKGCQSCNFGYLGRESIVEILFNSKLLKESIINNDEINIFNFMRDLKGYEINDIYEEAINLVRVGAITIEELESRLGARDIK